MLWLDVALILSLVAACIFFYYRVHVGLHYRWDWSSVPQYLFRYDVETKKWVSNILFSGFLMTVRIVIWSAIIAAVIGTIIGFAEVSKILLFRLIGKSYVELIRNIPTLVFVFIFYFFISSQILPAFNIDAMINEGPLAGSSLVAIVFAPPEMLHDFISGVICLAMLEAAYIAEIVRAGIQSLPKGQWEAGKTLGLGRFNILRFIVLPQALSKVWPPLANQFISLVKASSMVSLISIQELTFAGNDIAVSSGRVFEIWITVAAMYFVVCFSLSLLFRHLERTQRARSR